MPWLINAAQLDKFRKNQKNVIVLDASWYLPAENRSPYEEFLQAHIVGARFLDLNAFHETDTLLPNMLTHDESVIANRLGALGVTNDHKIILYDNSNLHTSCRALWMFKVFGHNPFQLYILDGGSEAWRKYGGKLEAGEPRQVGSKSYKVTYESRFIRTLAQMKHNQTNPQEQVVDMRHPVRYAGGPEHRPGMRSGHIPGSFCFPYFTMFESNGQWKPLERIRKQLTGLGVELSYPIVTTCGSGVSATILNAALDLMDHTNHAVYDGSWSEWGADKLYPGEESLLERPVKTSLE